MQNYAKKHNKKWCFFIKKTVIFEQISNKTGQTKIKLKKTLDKVLEKF